MTDDRCAKARTWMQAAVDGLEEGDILVPDEDVRQHLAECEDCRAEFEQLEETAETVKGAFSSLFLTEEESEALASSILESIDSTDGRRAAKRSRLAFAVAAAAVVLVAALAVGYFRGDLVRLLSLKATVGSVLDGEARLRSTGEIAWRTVQPKQAILAGDMLQTDEKSRCSILLGGTRLDMMPNTVLQALPAVRGGAARLDRGMVRVAVGPDEPGGKGSEFRLVSAGNDICSQGADFYVTAMPRESLTAMVQVVEGTVSVANAEGEETFIAGDLTHARAGKAPEVSGRVGCVIVSREEIQNLLGRVEGYARAKKRLRMVLLDTSRLTAEVARLREQGAFGRALDEKVGLLAKNREWARDEKRVLLGYCKELVALMVERMQAELGPRSTLLLASSLASDEYFPPVLAPAFLASDGADEIVESLPLPMLLYDGALFAGAVFDPGLFSMQRTQTIWNQDLRNKLLGAEFERKALKEGLARIRNYLQEINLRYIRERSERVSRSLEKRVRALRQEEISLCEKLNVRNRFFQGVPDRLAVPVVLVEKGPPVPDRAAKIAARLATHAFGRDMVRKLELEHFAIREKGRLFWEVRCEVAVVHPANDRTTWHACTFRIDATEPGNEEFVHNSVEIDR